MSKIRLERLKDTERIDSDEQLMPLDVNDSNDHKFSVGDTPVNLRIFDEAESLQDLEEYIPNLYARTPDELKDFREIQEIAKAAEPELKLLMQTLLRWHYNIFPTIATEDGIREWESWLELLKEVGDTLEDRRFRIKAKFNERLPYTWVQLHRMLAGICGWDGYMMELNELELRVDLSMDSSSQFRTVVDVLQRVVPQYILWSVKQFSRAKSTAYYGGIEREIVKQRFGYKKEALKHQGTYFIGMTMSYLTTLHTQRLDLTELT